jgi:ubiquinone/menaquinone biosynthesis C-methylase UbiE
MSNEQLDAAYEHLWQAHEGDIYSQLDHSLNPRSYLMLYEAAANAGLNSQSKILDAGCGTGNHSCELAQRFGCHVVGIEPVESNLEFCHARAKHEGLTGQVEFYLGQIESLQFAENSFDFIWCRDMLVHVAELEKAMLECARVLKPGGSVIAYTTVATDLMEPKEAARLYGPLSIAPPSVNEAFLEAAFTQAGLEIVAKQIIGSELLEYHQEQNGRYAKELMRIARMRRAKEKFERELGPSRYEVALALYHWGIYLLLGKLSSSIYILKK